MSEPGFTIYKNGSILGTLGFNNAQLDQISLAIAAIDAQIGIGTLVVPGTPGWVAGDRITVFSGTSLIFMGYVSDRGQQRQNVETLALETSYQLMDTNRQLIGRKVIDWAPGGTFPFEASVAAVGFLTVYAPELTIDTSSYVTADATNLPVKSYTGDGITDLLADLILYTGKTAFLLPGTADNTFVYHFHALTSGATASISIDDTPGNANGSTVFAPHRGASVSWSAADLHTNITVRNEITSVSGSSGSLSTHAAGGLKWEAVMNFTTDEDSLVLFGNNIRATAGDEKATYQCSIGPLTGAQVAAIPAGSLVTVTSVAMGLSGNTVRVSHLTITVSRDVFGNPVPGLWDVALELAYPIRMPTAVVGYGGQGGYAGGLAEQFLPVDHITMTPDFIPIGDFPVGDSTTVDAQLMNVLEKPVQQPDQTVTFTLVMWADEAETVAGTGWSISPGSDDTDVNGLASTVLTRDATGTAIKVWVEASL